eukprot:gene1724-biopygen21392
MRGGVGSGSPFAGEGGAVLRGAVPPAVLSQRDSWIWKRVHPALSSTTLRPIVPLHIGQLAASVTQPLIYGVHPCRTGNTIFFGEHLVPVPGGCGKLLQSRHRRATCRGTLGDVPTLNLG